MDRAEGPDVGHLAEQIGKMLELQHGLESRLCQQVATVEAMVQSLGDDVQALLFSAQSRLESKGPPDATTWRGQHTGTPSQSGATAVGAAWREQPGPATPSQSRDSPAGSTRTRLELVARSTRTGHPSLCRADKHVVGLPTPCSADSRDYAVMGDGLAFHPTSMWRLLFDLVTVLALAFDGFTVPFVLAWNLPARGALLFCMFLTSLVWTLDMLLHFVTGYYTDGLLELRLHMVATRYLRRWFTLDLFLVLMDWMNLVVALHFQGSDNSTTSLPMAAPRIFKAQRIIRIFSVLRLGRLWGRLQELDGFGEFFLSTEWHTINEVVKLFISLVFLNHVLCCVWFVIGGHGYSDTSGTWLDTFHGQESVGMWYQYSTALHWSVTQMTPGSMEVSATNSLERFFAICWLLFGMLFVSSIVSRLSAQMVQLQTQQQKHMQAMMLVRRFLRQRGVNAVLASHVLGAITQRTSAMKRLHLADVPFLSHCPGPLKSELWLNIFSPHISSHPLFHTWHTVDPHLTTSLCLACDLVFCDAGDELFAVGTASGAAYILASGRMSYTSCNCVPQGVSKGAMISEAAWWMEWATRGCLQSEAHDCELVRLKTEDLLGALEKHPPAEAMVRSYGRAFRTLASRLPPDDLSDLDTLDHAEIVAAMPQAARVEMAEVVMSKYKSARSSFNMFSSLQPCDPCVVSRLLSEVEGGQCAVVFDRQYKPTRAAILAAVHVTWPSRGWVLAQVATEIDDSFVPKCQLPATICKNCESAPDAADRLLDELRPLMPPGSRVQISAGDKRIVSQSSEKYSIHSQFIKTIFHVQIDSAATDGMSDAGTREFTNIMEDFAEIDATRSYVVMESESLSSERGCSRSSLAQGMHIYRSPQERRGSAPKLYAWMPAQEYERLQSDAGREELCGLISTLDMEVVDMSFAV